MTIKICDQHEYVVKEIFPRYVKTMCENCGTVKNFERELAGQVKT